MSKFSKLTRIILHGGPDWIKALRLGVAAGVEHLPVLRQLGDILTVVDIGANRGQFALAARKCFPDAQISSFEPLPGPAAKYHRIFASDQRSTLFEAAIGPESGKTTIHVSKRDDSSSLLPIATMQNQLFPGTAEAGIQNIWVGRLTEFLSAEDILQPALLKLDVQGFEREALIGCEDLLTCFTWVYVECSFVELYEGQTLADGIIAWLRKHGFLLVGVYNMSYDGNGRAIQADFLFRR